MTPDEQAKYYNAGFEEGIKHAKPSPQTEARLKSLEQAMEKLINKFDQVPETLVAIQKDLQRNSEILEELTSILSELEPRVRKLENWRSGIVFVGMLVMAIMSITAGFAAHSLNLQIKDIARKVVIEELQKYEVIINK